LRRNGSNSEMMRREIEKSILEELKGCEVSAVTFVRDYLQLQFDGPYLNLFVWPQVLRNGTTFEFGDPGYKDALCALIGKSVAGIFEETDKTLRLFFVDGSIAEVSLLFEDRRGPEAALFQNGKGECRVW
jgi:hypothetical protein